MKVLIFLFFIFGFGFSGIASAASPADVVINEIAWTGTKVSYNDEWIELYNNTASSVNLDGWILKAEDGTPEINLTGAVPANGFYLLERTDDDTVPGVPADQFYKGALGNKGEVLVLYDNFGNAIDRVSCSEGWFAGDNSTKHTMSRQNLDNWANSQNPGGTPRAENNIATEPEISLEEPVIEQELEPVPENQPESPKEEPKIVYPSGIVISEILPSPTGSDIDEEWIEIFNQNNFEVGLFEWQITDAVGKTNIYIFPKETTLGPKEFLVLARPTTKITLNNGGDGLKLIQPDGNVLDAVNYEKAPRGESYNLTDGGSWTWSATLTPGSFNILPGPEEKTSKNNPPRVEKIEIGQGVATVGEQIPKSPKSLSALLIAVATAIFSGTMILILRKKLTAGV